MMSTVRMLRMGMMGSLILAAVIANASEEDHAQVGKIIGRAAGLMAQAKEGTVEIEDVVCKTRLGSGEQKAFRNWTRISRDRSGLYVRDVMGFAGERTVQWSDGRLLREFSHDLAKPNIEDLKITERTLLEGDYSSVYSHRFIPLSPFKSMFNLIKWEWSPDANLDAKYVGKRKLRGEICDVIEIYKQIPPTVWAKTVEKYPDAPEKGAEFSRLYLQVADGRLMRIERSHWQKNSQKIDGKWIGEDYPSARIESTTDFFCSAALPPEEYQESRFYGKIRGALAGLTEKFPRVVQLGDEWQGKALPAMDLQTLDGKSVSWEDFRGRVLVVETWFIGCTYCKYAFPYYNKLRTQLKNQGVTFMALNTGDKENNSPQHVKEWLSSNPDKYDFLWVQSDTEIAAEKLKSSSAPLFFVVGTDGKIVSSYRSFGYGKGGEDPRLIDALRKAGVQL